MEVQSWGSVQQEKATVQLLVHIVIQLSEARVAILLKLPKCKTKQ